MFEEEEEEEWEEAEDEEWEEEDWQITQIINRYYLDFIVTIHQIASHCESDREVPR